MKKIRAKIGAVFIIVLAWLIALCMIFWVLIKMHLFTHM